MSEDLKICGNCKYGKTREPQPECLDCKLYNKESLNNNWTEKKKFVLKFRQKLGKV